MQHASINNTARYRLQQFGMGDAPEVVREVGVNDFRVAYRDVTEAVTESVLNSELRYSLELNHSESAISANAHVVTCRVVMSPTFGSAIAYSTSDKTGVVHPGVAKLMAPEPLSVYCRAIATRGISLPSVAAPEISTSAMLANFSFFVSRMYTAGRLFREATNRSISRTR